MMPLKRYNRPLFCCFCWAATVAPSRHRARAHPPVFRGEDKSISVDLKNANSKLPYLAQSRMEDEKGVKITSPLIVVPPVQRIEPSAIGQVKIQGCRRWRRSQDRETLFITTCAKFRRKATSPIRCKLPCKRASKFLPPAGAIENRYAASRQYKITLQRQGNGYQVSNPTGYYVVLSNASNRMDGTPARGFSPLVIAPKAT